MLRVLGFLEMKLTEDEGEDAEEDKEEDDDTALGRREGTT
jgi:hypothetical protein